MGEELVVAAATRDAAADDEHLAIVISLLAMIAEEDKPTIGGSAQGRRKSNLRQRMKGYCMLYANYFVDDPLHGDAIFHRRFRMSDTHDDYLHMAESTAIDCMYRICRPIVAVFGKTYLRTPNAADTTRILAQNAERGFPRMFDSIGFMHRAWKNCPFAHHGSHNDINVMQCSNVFQKLVEGNAPPVQFEINDHQYDKGYYLVDGVYPRWSTFVKKISNHIPVGKKAWFAQMLEAAKKDVERAFSVLQVRFAIVRYPALTWSKEQMREVMTACVILHNMIMESEQEFLVFDIKPYEWMGPLADVDHNVPPAFAAFIVRRHEV
ncbi:uncharacterized protein [Lolium perenne]|uniref:uncharacterized protein n=1 Tax=Lolium perenne TaxID=4522 RepID=UPI003A98F536